MFNFWPFNIARKRRAAHLNRVIADQQSKGFTPTGRAAPARVSSLHAVPPVRQQMILGEPIRRRETASAPSWTDTAPDPWPLVYVPTPYASPSPEADAYRGAGGSFDGGGASGDWSGSDSGSSSSSSDSSSSDSGSSSCSSD